ncbi:MAG: molybdopterin cofactor-binding domain-containing protein [candidate division KSB1 bacterium]|nr:molybdopterin cofactor-binding domain-containing protein [candidate division KSB1 bacterium]
MNGSPDSRAHVRGESPFIDDLPEPSGALHAAVYASPCAHGIIRNLDCTPALAVPGVSAVYTAADIPGDNQIGTIIRDEPLLATDTVHYIGQPLALVVAKDPMTARKAAALIQTNIKERPAVFDPRQSAARGDLIAPARTLSLGDVDSAWARCAASVSGQVESGGQEHLYLETQASLCIPESRGRLRIFAGTQSPSAVQRVTAQVLGLQMHDIQVEVQRLGGAFGGKEDQATPWAVMTALAALNLQKPVKLTLRRGEDMRLTGKRHPYSTDYKLGLDADGCFIAFEATYYQNSGAAADLSTAVMERTLFHATGSYYIPNVRVTGLCCRTHLPPFTAFRGFGAPQAMFVMEAAIAAAAEQLDWPPRTLQQTNLLRKNDELPYGMRMQTDTVRRSYNKALSQFNVDARLREIDTKNNASRHIKYGLALMPVTFGISFTNTMLNQAGALVHIYQDGSVSVSTAAVEMGQGVLTKLRHIVARSLGISETKIRIESTSTARVANMSPTAASTATDLNGAAALSACRMLSDRLITLAASLLRSNADHLTLNRESVWMNHEQTHLGWSDLVECAYRRRIDLSAHAFYATPDIYYDKKSEKGHPFAYHVSGTAVVEARLDALRGTASIESVRVIHDAGRSLDLLVDRGQAEGGIVQAIGWMTLEELVYNEKGQLLSDSMSTYKVPDIYFAPPDLEVVFPENSDDPGAVMQTKAIGEPPFMYGIGAWLAIRDAMRNVRRLPHDILRAPLTHERILDQPARMQGIEILQTGLAPDMHIRLNLRDHLSGLLIYAAGDTAASLMLNEFAWTRLIGMMAVGATVYALEIPAWFRWIDRRTAALSHGYRKIALRTALALLYFNPLWIARHLFFITLFSSGWSALSWSIFRTALLSWLVNIPIAIIGNAVIQGLLPLRWRFTGSATFSALLALYYALSRVWFHA